MKERRDRILDVAISLAEEGGYDNVRQRDVAARAGVALGTLYKSFRSKEDILSAALERETEVLERRVERHPLRGDSADQRIANFFTVVTRAMCRKPNYARAILRAMASGEPEIAANVTAYQGRMAGLIIAALRGVGRLGFAELQAAPPTERERTLALLLQEVWFSALVGWTAGLTDEAGVLTQMRTAAALLLRATAPPGEAP